MDWEGREEDWEGRGRENRTEEEYWDEEGRRGEKIDQRRKKRRVLEGKMGRGKE